MQKTDSGKLLKGSVIFQFCFPLTHFRDYWGSRKINQRMGPKKNLHELQS